MREFAAVNTPDEYILCVEDDNGNVFKEYERRRISDDVVEVIQHMNRDRQGRYYTTRHTYKISEGCVVNPYYRELRGEEYKIYLAKQHMLMLAKSEELHRNTGDYNNLSESVKRNCIERVKRYIANRTDEEKMMPEYQVFINSMEKSLAIFEEAESAS